MLLKHTHIVVESGWATNKQSEQQLRNYSKMKVYGAISSSLAEDAPLLLHNTQDEKTSFVQRRFHSVVAKDDRAGGRGRRGVWGRRDRREGERKWHFRPDWAFRLGDALEDAKAGKKETFVPI